MSNFVMLRLGKDSVDEIKQLDSLHEPPQQPVCITVICKQVPSEVKEGFYCFIYLGSDNSKGTPTDWLKGLRALGRVVGKEGSGGYSEQKEISIEVGIVLPESISKEDLLARASNEYYWMAGMPVLGLNSYSNQTVQLIKSSEPTQNINALFCAIAKACPPFEAYVKTVYSDLESFFQYISLDSDFEGDSLPAPSVGWEDYPLDAVFVREERRSVSDIVKRIEKKRIVLDPEFQRDFVWSVKKQSRMIESCLMRIPLPVLYVAEADDGRIVIVDGLQRLTTFKHYLNNQFSLSLPEGNHAPKNDFYAGKKFNELSTALQERIEDTQLTLYILDAKAPERAKLDIFERVNSGEALSRQQMRNCLYTGPATKWLKTAASHDVFLRATGRSIDPKSMRA